VGFEPEPAEAARLQASPDPNWHRHEILPLAVGATDGKATLYVPTSTSAASLRPHNQAMCEMFGNDILHGTSRTIEVNVVTLDRALPAETYPWLDFIKLDIEGIEHEVLEAAPRCVASASGMKVEAAFVEQRIGQKKVWEVMDLLVSRGFVIADWVDVHRWRRRPVPGDPYVTRYDMPYSRGLLAQCDIIALRQAKEMPEALATRAILTSAALGYFDHAVSIARCNPDAVRYIESVTRTSLEQDLKVAAADYGHRRLRDELGSSLRHLVPLFRSMLGRLPFRTDFRPY
jgi:FkbM family methyltransferase